MPLFMSPEEYRDFSHDPSLIVEKADAFIRNLMNELETVKAQSDAASITAEQTCSLLEQKYVSLSAEFATLQSQHSQLNATLDERLSELAQIQSQNREIDMSSIGKDGEIHRLSTEIEQLHKSKRQLMELLEQKDLEIIEKNSTIKSYLDKIVNLTENAALKEARLSDLESELARSHASSSRISQEKELVERHNSWLNDELKTKVDDLIELRRTHGEIVAEMSAKLSDGENRLNEISSALKWSKDRVAELESKLASVEQDLISAKDASSATEKQFSSEISTLTKLVDLYKESAEEWSKKAGELEGVIKALETHLSQVESENKEMLEKEVSAKKAIEKDANDLKEKLDICLAELESLRKTDELKLMPTGSFVAAPLLGSVETNDVVQEDHMVLRNLPVGVSGTALAAALLRDGWSLAKMYSKYQEAVDALRHEQLGKKQSEAILERVLHKLEEKANAIMDERVEHERTVEAYSALDQKLRHSLTEQTELQRHIEELKADLRRKEREYVSAQKEIVDLQNQVTVLLKECQDIQLRCGSIHRDYGDALMAVSAVSPQDEYDTENVNSGLTLAFRDISGLVEQNVQLRRLVHTLSEEIVSQETQLKEKYERDLQKHTEEASSKVNAVLARAEEQQRMIESLHTSVAMYKKLYEEADKLRSLGSISGGALTEEGRQHTTNVVDDSHESLQRAHNKAQERVKYLEEELSKSRIEIISLRSDNEKFAMEAQLAKEKLERFMKEFDHQKDQHNSLIARNVEFTQLIIEHQRKLRENSDSLNSAMELSRKLTMEVSLLKQEKEILSNSEKRAIDEVRSMSERVHRLQACLDTIKSTEEVREEARCAERAKQELYIKQIEREWAEAKKELQEERDMVRHLTLEKENSMNHALKQVEEAGKELSKALRALGEAEARASVAEARYSDLEEKMRLIHVEASKKIGKGQTTSANNDEIVCNSDNAKEEIERLREEAQNNKDHLFQYKSIAFANEESIKQLEATYEKSKAEAEVVKKSLEEELLSLRKKVAELQGIIDLKTNEVVAATAGKEEAVTTALLEVSSLKESFSAKMSEISVLETKISSLDDDLEKERKKSSAAEANYKRQVILLSDTIQDLTKTSQAFAQLQEEASELRKSVVVLKTENDGLKAKWEAEKTALEVVKNDADRKYNEVNELNKVLLSRLEAFHIKQAEKDRHSSGVSASSPHSSLDEDDGLQSVVKYLRRSKEIAEAEISLLKQERLRLKSQLETAVKAADTAQASLDAAHRNSKSLFFSEEEFKSLQLQVQEISVLRESNMQLREENRHNFEECQKLRETYGKARTEIEYLERSVGEKQNEVEACRKEIENLSMEKEDLKKQVDELLERSKNVDIEEYDRMKETVQQLQINLEGKDTELEEIKRLLSERQDEISRLEADVNRSKLEISEKESRVNDIVQTEASLRSEVDKQRRMITQQKRKLDNLTREKEELSKENQVLSKNLEDLKQGKRTVGDAVDEQAIKEKEKEKDTRIQRKMENLTREKEELSKENQVLSKNLEELKQGKKTAGDAADEQAMKEKEKEKDTRIQILERTVERLREELRKEKEENKTEKGRRLKTQKTISDSYEAVSQQHTKLSHELEKHKWGLKMLADDLEKLKVGNGNQSEGTTGIQFLSGTLLEDLTTAYHLAVENFHQAAQPVFSDPILSATESPSTLDATPAGTSTMGQVLSTTVPSANLPPSKAVDDREKKLILPKQSIIESRKVARRLVRPRISKPVESSQGDVEMSEVETSDNSVKPVQSDSMETQGNLTLLPGPDSRKRPLLSNELGEELPLASEEAAEPSVKKSKSSEAPQDSGEGVAAESYEGQAAVEALPGSEEMVENAAVVPDGLKDSCGDTDKDEMMIGSGERQQQGDETKEREKSEIDKGDVGDDEVLSVLNSSLSCDDLLLVKNGGEQENEQGGGGGGGGGGEYGSEREEGELVTEVGDVEGAGVSMGSPELESEGGMTPPEIVGGGVDDEAPSEVGGGGEAETSSQALEDEKNEEGEDSGTGGENVETTDEVSEAGGAGTSNAERVVSPAAASSGVETTTESEEGRRVSPTISRSSTTINLNERAKERASLRRGNIIPSSLPPAPSSSSRGRGRTARGRGRSYRGGGGGGGQSSSGKQG